MRLLLLRVALLTILAAAGLSYGSSVRAQQGGSISGTVTDAQGTPLEGCYVYADSWDGDGSFGMGLADADGLYVITGLGQDDYLVYPALCEGYIQEYYDNVRNSGDATRVPVTDGQITPDVDVDFALEGRSVKRWPTSTAAVAPQWSTRC
jgi:hypothetical protein